MHQELHALRVAAGLSQRQLGDLLGVSGSAVCYWEAEGGSLPSAPALLRLAHIYSLTDVQTLRLMRMRFAPELVEGSDAG